MSPYLILPLAFLLGLVAAYSAARVLSSEDELLEWGAWGFLAGMFSMICVFMGFLLMGGAIVGFIVEVVK